LPKTRASRGGQRSAKTTARHKTKAASDAPLLAAEDAESEGVARGLWSGTLSFGLVTIPVELMPSTRHVRTSLRMLAPDGTPLQRRYFCEKQDKMLEWDEIVRGYELDKGKFVVVTDEELDALAPKQSRDIDVSRFVDRKELDPMFFERTYFLVPDSDSNTAYRLLAETMEQGDKAGIASFVMRGKQYLVAILADDGILRAEILRFAEELRSPKDLGLKRAAKADARAVKRFRSVIKKLAKPKLSPTELADNYWHDLVALAEKKRAKHRDIVMPEHVPEESKVDVIDLMTVLKQSLSAANESSRDRKSTGSARARKPLHKAKSRRATRKAS
jgi:DNA end-binding protein Ku